MVLERVRKVGGFDEGLRAMEMEQADVAHGGGVHAALVSHDRRLTELPWLDPKGPQDHARGDYSKTDNIDIFFMVSRNLRYI